MLRGCPSSTLPFYGIFVGQVYDKKGYRKRQFSFSFVSRDWGGKAKHLPVTAASVLFFCLKSCQKCKRDSYLLFIITSLCQYARIFSISFPGCHPFSFLHAEAETFKDHFVENFIYT